MIWFIIFAIMTIMVFAILGANHSSKKIAEKTDAMNTILSNMENFTVSKKIVSQDGSSVFAIDQVNRQIAVMKDNTHNIFAYDNIISVELIEDNTTLSSKSTIRTIGGAVVGGTLAGGAGMIVGGLSGNSTTKEKVSNLRIKILLRDIDTPSITINCFDSRTMTTEGKKEMKKDGLEGWRYKVGYQQAEEIKDMLSVIIDSVDNKQKNNIVSEKTSKTSVSDELLKLHDLKEKGILSEEEFNKLKSEIIKA